jgi:hypothetical protein
MLQQQRHERQRQPAAGDDAPAAGAAEQPDVLGTGSVAAADEQAPGIHT